MQVLSPSHPNLLELERKLDAALRDSGGESRVAQCLRQAVAEPSSWHKYALFGSAGYSRNLVMRSDLFELLVLCWTAGQQSPIHDHQGQRCWMAVLEGRVEERLYAEPRPTRGAVAPRALEPLRTKTFDTGGVAFITDDLGLHDIRPVDGQRAMSVHLYSRPIQVARIFDPHSLEVRERTLAYDSIDGVRCAAP